MIRKLFLGLLALGIGLYVGIFVLPYHFSPQKPIDESTLTGLFSPDERIGTFLGRLYPAPYIPPILAFHNILGATTDYKRIEVDLTNQKLYAFEGNDRKYEFPISSGLWGRTPTGEFRIWIKLRFTKMEGGSKALNTYYNLPNVPYVMFFSNDSIPKYRGFGIHGTYWHSNFGHPMSHGCINMKTEDAEVLYKWADPPLDGKSVMKVTDNNAGTRIVIYGAAPDQ